MALSSNLVMMSRVIGLKRFCFTQCARISAIQCKQVIPFIEGCVHMSLKIDDLLSKVVYFLLESVACILQLENAINDYSSQESSCKHILCFT